MPPDKTEESIPEQGNLIEAPAVTEVETPEVDEVAREQAVMDAAMEAAAIEDGLPAKETEEEPGPEPEAEPEPEDAQPAESEPEPEAEPEPLSDEEQDAEDAKKLGFKNMKATTEFKAMRAELRELRPLKEQVEQFQKPAQQWGELTGYFEERAITPDQFGQAMTVVSAFNSTDLTMKRQAAEILEGELRALKAQIGEEGGGYDPLAEPENRDLAEAVDGADLSRERALEIAKLRHESRHNQTVSQRAAESRQQQETTTTDRQNAVAELNAIGEEYSKLDKDYQRKTAILTPILKPIFADLPPRLWGAKFKEAYAGLSIPADAPAKKHPAPLRNQPLRPSAQSGNMAAELRTQDDIIDAALRRAAELDGVAY